MSQAPPPPALRILNNGSSTNYEVNTIKTNKVRMIESIFASEVRKEE